MTVCFDLASWHAAEKWDSNATNPFLRPSLYCGRSISVQRSPIATPECRADEYIDAVEANADGAQMNSADDIS